MTGRSTMFTGWEPTAPVGDTYLRRFVLAWAETLARPVSAAGGRVVRTADAVITDAGGPASYWNGAVLIRPPEVWEAVIAGIEKHLGAGRPTHLWSAWPTPDLASSGWRLEGHPPFQLRPAGGPLPPAADGLEVVAVREASTYETWARVAVDGYPFAELLPYRTGTFLAPAVLDGGLHAWLAHAGGEPVGAAASVVAHGLHVLGLGVVLPHARRRGYWEALLRARLATFPELPSASLFSDMSAPGARRHGYLPISRFTLWVRDE